MKNPRLVTNARIATMQADGDTQGPAAYGLIDDGVVAIDDGCIAWVGPRTQLPGQYRGLEAIDAGGRLVTPGLVDCHSHLVFGGNRAQEFELRLNGASYEEIARAGGGILSTVKATRAASEVELIDAALPHLDRMLADGVTTLEVKSGYGLDTLTELKMLRAARKLGELRPVRIVTTFLGAHAVPPEFKDRPDDYVSLVCDEMIPCVMAEKLADAVDGFCEGIAFSPAQIARVFEAARAVGLPVKLHAEQLSNLGGAALAASYGALSADHIEYLDASGVAAMAAAGSVGVVLPGAFYVLREKQVPPIAALRTAGVPIAVATDFNPGSSPVASIRVAMNMACTLFRMTPAEALAGATRQAAKALGLSAEIGSVAPGMSADLAVWNVSEPAELSYWIGTAPLHARVYRGDVFYQPGEVRA